MSILFLTIIPHRCIHTFDDIIGTSLPESKSDVYHVSWSPNGDLFAVAGLGGGIIIITFIFKKFHSCSFNSKYFMGSKTHVSS